MGRKTRTDIVVAEKSGIGCNIAKESTSKKSDAKGTESLTPPKRSPITCEEPRNSSFVQCRINDNVFVPGNSFFISNARVRECSDFLDCKCVAFYMV